MEKSACKGERGYNLVPQGLNKALVDVYSKLTEQSFRRYSFAVMRHANFEVRGRHAYFGITGVHRRSAMVWLNRALISFYRLSIIINHATN